MSACCSFVSASINVLQVVVNSVVNGKKNPKLISFVSIINKLQITRKVKVVCL